ncbi:hypothetical protein GOBAR_DD08557 [Gossypium barbadense]|nr:hypothetical protein GOBAR_DD08557 [Gossypium barbadense]
MQLLQLNSSVTKGQSNGGNNRALLYLNVYDLTPINKFLYWLGLGVFHSGIEDDRYCWVSTDMSRSEFRLFMEELSQKYRGDTYHLVARNCNHFTDDVCMQLTGKHIPGWVNRLARLGSFCNCLLPESIQIPAVWHVPDRPAFSDDERSNSAGTSLTGESEEEEADHHLLTTPNIDVAFLKGKPVRIAKELL